ncbi:MAG: magnesium transporter [Magnetococcales bacterium]|nr:magnesium transporter [Magnetococcales bacterium]
MVAVLERHFFLCEMIGRGVYLRANRIGRLEDMVMVESGRLPEVSHFVVGRPYGHPALLLPLDKLALISNTEIVFDVDSPTAFERQPPAGSILLRAHVLDKKVLDLDDHEVEIVYDVILGFQGTRLYVSEVDFSKRRLFRRMGLKVFADWVSQHKKERTLSWKYVQPLPEHIDTFKGHVKLNVLRENISDIHPVDMADILEELEGAQRLAVFEELDSEHASDTLEEVEPRVQRELIGAIDKKRAAELIDQMTPARAAYVLAALPANKADELLALIDPETVSRVQQIIDKHDENVLLYATDAFIRQSPIAVARDVIDHYRQLARDKEVIMYVYVTAADDTLLGVVDIRELLTANDNQTLAEIMTENVITLAPENTLRDALDMLERYSFRAIPVADPGNRILGVISYRSIKGLTPRLNATPTT